MMEGLDYYLRQAKEGNYAIGHFNFATEDVLRGIIEASRDAGAPAVMVGTSGGEADFVGMKEAVALVKVMRENFDFPVFLNADHFKSFDKCKEAIDAGYDSVIADGSKLPMAENIAFTKQVVEYAKEVSKFKNLNISVEGELGYLRGSSEVQKKIEISPADYSKPQEVADFVSRTGVDRMAIVFGNIHGIVTDQKEKLDIEHFSRIVSALQGHPVSFVLHGASGLKDEDVVASIKAGITNVHFNTELRVAYRNEIDKQFHEHPNETTPYKYLGPAVDEVKKLVAQKIRLFMWKN
ncbi:MAG: ketose-bisphosphate aldolase [Candidatus Omnitrophica bacterium]|nr:ketose-bisphosphate aldolase [Candidatus Omnitrophota bacterium]